MLEKFLPNTLVWAWTEGYPLWPAVVSEYIIYIFSIFNFFLGDERR